LTLRWATWAASDAALEMEMRSTSPDHYVGFGVAASGMAGRIIVCAVDAAGGAPQCSEWAGASFGIGTRQSGNAAAILAVSAERSASSLAVRLRLNATALGVVAGPQRVIFAVGAYNAQANAPTRHATVSDRGSATVDFAATAAASTTAASSTATTTPSTAGPGPTPRPTAAPIPVPAAAKVEAPRFALLGGTFGASWRVYAASEGSSGDVVEFTLDTAAGPGRFIAIGLAAEQMSGHIVICATGAVPSCSDWIGSGLAIAPAGTPATSVVSVATTAAAASSSRRLLQSGGTSTTTFTFRIAAATLGVASGSQRLISATGAFDEASGWPSQHAPGDRAGSVIDVNGGTASSGDDADGFFVAFVVTLVVCAVGLLAAAALNASRIVLGPTAGAAAAVSVGVCFVGLAALMFGMRYSDHVANAKAWPVERAFGDAAVFCFWFVLYPVPKNNAIAKAAGSSFERLVPYHVLIALVLYLAMTAHFIGMAIKLETADAIFTADADARKHPPLWGFCAWAATTVVVLPALALRRRFYWVLRLAHLCAPVAIIFGILHYFPLIYALIPPLFAYAVDWALRVRATVAAKPQLVDVRHSATGGFTQLDVKLAPGARSPGPGAFVLLGLSSVGTRLHPHPFSVAWYDAHARVATVLCKDMGPGTWTGELAAAAARDPTALLAGTDVQWTGPFGSLQVPLGTTRVAVLVAGGIGVTPILNLLRVIRRDTVRRGGLNAITNVIVLWSLRTPELLAATRHKWASVWGDAGDDDDGGENGGRGETAAGVLGVHTPRGGDGAGDAFGSLHDSFSSLGHDGAAAGSLPTSKPGLLGPRVYGELFSSALQLAPHDARPFAVVRQRRVDFDTDVPRVLEKAVRKRDAPVTLYCCGPAALMDDAARFARARVGKTYLHTETFEL